MISEKLYVRTYKMIPASNKLTWTSEFSLENAKTLVFMPQRLEYGQEPEGFETVWSWKIPYDSAKHMFASLLKGGTMEPDQAVLVVRGTDPTSMYEDFCVDLDIRQVDIKGFRVHSGGWRVTNKMWKVLAPVLIDNGVKRLYLTGHSLGAGVVNLVPGVADLDLELLVYAFAPFRAGDEDYCRYCDSRVFAQFSLVNLYDVVPSVPPFSRLQGRIGIFKEPRDTHSLTTYYQALDKGEVTIF